MSLHDKLRKKEDNWHFTLLCASYKGSFYEAFFQFVRKSMKSIVSKATFNKIDLLTLVRDKQILNNHPLTKLLSYTNDLSALTPNMIFTSVTC